MTVTKRSGLPGALAGLWVTEQLGFRPGSPMWDALGFVAAQPAAPQCLVHIIPFNWFTAHLTLENGLEEVCISEPGN